MQCVVDIEFVKTMQMIHRSTYYYCYLLYYVAVVRYNVVGQTATIGPRGGGPPGLLSKSDETTNYRR